VISAAASSDGTQSIDIHRRDGKHMYVTGAMWQEGRDEEGRNREEKRVVAARGESNELESGRQRER
jgi:hypothetical protein